MFDKNPQWRLSNNNQPADFTDQEAITIYLFVGRYWGYSQVIEMHHFAVHLLSDWFPNLTSYEKFNNRLNTLKSVFYHMAIDIFSNHIPTDAQLQKQIIDSMPIITAKGKKRIGKVATELTDKGFCPSKNLYYYGLKLHMLAFVRSGTMPFPNKIFFSSASQNDLAVEKEQNWFDNLIQTQLFADKAYCETDYFETRKQWIQLDLFTPFGRDNDFIFMFVEPSCPPTIRTVGKNSKRNAPSH